MNATKHFASLLYFAVLFCLIFSSVYFLISLSAKYFGTDGQYIINTGNKSSLIIGNKNSEGYQVPVNLTLQIPDSIKADKKYFEASAEDSYPHLTNTYLKENKKVKAINIYDVSNMSPDSKVLIIDSDGKYRNRKASKFQFIKYSRQGDSQYLKIKTTDSSTNLLLALREQVNFLLYIIEMYFLALILREIAREIYFSQTLSKYISRLGYILLFSQLIPLLYSFVDIRLFGAIQVTPQILESLQNTYFENIKVSFNPTINVEIYIVFLGSVLVLLTKLIERGRALEEENELTI